MCSAILPLSLCLAASTVIGCGAADEVALHETNSHPNIVFVMADDLGRGDLGCYSTGSLVPTPHIDSIAVQGMRFTDAHSPSAVCTPTRYGVLTGRYAWRTPLRRGVLWGDSRSLLERGRTTVASLLKRAGYRTACVGKWHLGLGEEEPVDFSKPITLGPLDFGFDEFFGIPASLDQGPYVYLRGDRASAALDLWMDETVPRRSGGSGFIRADRHSADFVHSETLDLVTAEGIAFLERCATTPETPFFLYLPLTAPHTPWLPREEFEGASGAGPYGDFAVHVDACVGRVDAALERLGMTGETLLIVTSDNGAHWMPEDIALWKHRANGNSRGQKADIWEGGHRVPFVVRWPGRIEALSLCDTTVALSDLMATCAAITGVELAEDEGEDSFDLTPLFLGGDSTRPAREALVHHSFDGTFAIRKGAWKLIFGLGSGGFSEPVRELPIEGGPTGQLYDLENDPGETRNVILEHPERVRELALLMQAYSETGRSRPLAEDRNVQSSEGN